MSSWVDTSAPNDSRNISDDKEISYLEALLIFIATRDATLKLKYFWKCESYESKTPQDNGQVETKQEWLEHM